MKEELSPQKLKYRIKEYCGLFEIQIWSYEDNGTLWWKKKIWDWYPTNSSGGVLQRLFLQQPSGSFNTLEEAQKRVDEWRKGVTYHSLDTEER